MPPAGQWADLAPAAPQSQAAVMHPLHSSNSSRKGRDKGRAGQGSKQGGSNKAGGKGSTAKGKKAATHRRTGRAKQQVMFGLNVDPAPD